MNGAIIRRCRRGEYNRLVVDVGVFRGRARDVSLALFLSHTHTMIYHGRPAACGEGEGAVVFCSAAQSCSAAASATAGHPPLATTTLFTFCDTVTARTRTTHGVATARRPTSDTATTKSPLHRAALRTTHRTAGGSEGRGWAERGFHIVARVLFCVRSSAVHRTRRAHCLLPRRPLPRLVHTTALARFSFLRRRLRVFLRSVSYCPS